MGNVGERIKYWMQLLWIPVYGLSFLVPRDKKLWLFGSTFGKRFADNPRYFYLYLNQHQEDGIRPIWITRNRRIVNTLTQWGYEAYYHYSLKSIWYCLRGKVYLYDNYPKDISHWLSGGAIKINLWHGVPLKKIQMDNLHDRIRHPSGCLERWRAFPRRLSDEKAYHYIVATSHYFAPIFSSAFATERVLVTGYPRTDIFREQEPEQRYSSCEKEGLKQIGERGIGKKIFLYMPTFRESEKKFFDVMDLRRLQEFLKKKNFLLCLKLHCKSKLKEAFDVLEGENIVVITPEADPNVFVGLADVLITDYSSVYFDYLLTGRPIVYFCYDLEEYVSGSRELYFDYNSFTPGTKAKTQSQLEQAMLQAQTGNINEAEKKKYEEILEKAFGSNCSGSNRRLAKAIKGIVT